PSLRHSPSTAPSAIYSLSLHDALPISQRGLKLRERALGDERVARLAGEKVQALQGEGGHAVSRWRGVVVAGLGAVDQPLVIVAGEEEPAVRLVLELLEQHFGKVLGKSEHARVEFRLQQLQERGKEIG